MTTQHFIAAAALAAGLVAGAPALAADATASVQVTRLQFTASNGLSVNWLSDSMFQSLFAESREAGGLGGNDLADPGFGSTWADQLLDTSTAHAAASAQAGANGLLAVAGSASRSLFSLDAGQSHRALAWANQAGWFQLSGAGSLQISLDYTIAATGPLGDGLGSFAGATLQLQAGNLDTASDGLAEDQVWSFDLPSSNGSDARSGTLSLLVDISDPLQTGYYDLRANVDVSAVSSVPEPGGWAMLALGLATLGALVRRQQRAG